MAIGFQCLMKIRPPGCVPVPGLGDLLPGLEIFLKIQYLPISPWKRP